MKTTLSAVESAHTVLDILRRTYCECCKMGNELGFRVSVCRVRIRVRVMISIRLQVSVRVRIRVLD